MGRNGSIYWRTWGAPNGRHWENLGEPYGSTWDHLLQVPSFVQGEDMEAEAGIFV